LKRLVAFAVLIMLLLSGCAFINNREFSVVYPHFKQNREWQNSGDYTAQSFNEITDILKNLISSGKSEGVVWVDIEDKNIQDTLDRICEDTIRNDPVAAFAVEEIDYVLTPLVAELKLELSIKYSRTQKEIFEIKYIHTNQELANEIRECLSIYQDRLLLMVNSFYELEKDIEKTFYEVYYSELDYVYGITGIEYTAYPERGSDRVVEINIKRDSSPDVSKNIAGMVNAMARSVVGIMPEGLSRNEQATWLYDYTREAVFTDAAKENISGQRWSGYIGTAFGALIEKKADSEGIAMAYKKLCDFADIGCMVVSGEREGERYAWNLVALEDGCWYHIDCFAEPSDEPGYVIFYNDSQMEGYIWDRINYPGCISEEFITEELSQPEPEGEQPDQIPED
jgi:hypothetical protein